jgi:hypothetical protein|tara:strand:- start:50 stop:856 length:807 start_codon:yes stop_codon:yes gene_type:complete
MNKLWTFGDSFSTGGSKNLWKMKHFNNMDIHCRFGIVNFNSLKIEYSSYLSKMLGLENYNLSVGGNDQVGIVKDIWRVSHLFKEDDIIIVAYSSPFRGFEPKVWKKAVVDRDSRWDGKPLWESAKLDSFEDESVLLDYYSYVMLQYKKYIEITEEILEGKNFILMQAFNPVFGYYDTSLLPKENKNFIEWNKKNNTLHDICQGSWLRDDEENYMMQKQIFSRKEFQKMKTPPKRFRNEYLANCSHPSLKGHELIAKTLLPYVEERLGF